jgi:hypothetical protein
MLQFAQVAIQASISMVLLAILVQPDAARAPIPQHA